MKAGIFVLVAACLRSEIKFIEPSGLVQSLGGSGEIKFSISTFGELLYTETSMIRVISPSDAELTGCESLTLPKGMKGEKFIWLVKRGGCTYSKKAFISQQTGAFAVLVYHNDPDTSIDNIIPISDSIYSNIKIPIILIKNADGVRIRDFTSKEELVTAKIHLEVLRGSTTHVSAEYWMNPASLESYKFILAFSEFADGLGDVLDFKVLYKFRNLSGDSDASKNLCFANGRFCATETFGFEPNSVLREGVRQICIWNISEKRKDKHTFWKQYIRAYKDCVEDKLELMIRGAPPCFSTITSVLRLENSLIDEINSCVDASYENKSSPQTSRNFLLESNENSFEYSQVYLVPALFLNGNLVKERLSPVIVLSAICDKLEAKPAICSTYFTNSIDWDYNRKESFNKSVIAIVSIAAIGFIVLFAILCLVRQCASRSVSSEISFDIKNHVTEYMRVKNSK